MHPLNLKKIRKDNERKYQKKIDMNHKKTFKEKVKNFFKIPEEVFEEEPSPKFEKIKLITLTRNKIFFILAFFLIIVNVLVGFDINFLYLRQILGFLFLILVPGLLIMLCFKIRTVKFWEFLVYTIGLSVAFIMFAGLAVNWTLPALNITDKPLSLWPILICFNIFLIALGIVGYKRNKDFIPFQLTVPKLDALNSIFFIIPMTFPVLAILGAFLLNNHGPNILTMIMLGSIAVYVLLLIIFRKRLNENIWPWALWMTALALLLSFSMRSWFVVGFDINHEYLTFLNSFFKQVWNFSNYPDGYNSCLSLTIFPTIAENFIHLQNYAFLFKFFIQVIFSFATIIIYSLFKKSFNKLISFYSILFIVFQTTYLFELPSLIRQEFAFIFFSLILLILFSDTINEKIKKILFLIFGLSMILSHYSTSYITLAIFVFIYLINKIALLFSFHKKNPSKNEFYLPGTFILLLLLFGFLWYGQITNTGEGLIDVIKQSVGNLRNIFVSEATKTSFDQLFFRINNFNDLNINQHFENIHQSFLSQNSYLSFYNGENIPKVSFNYPEIIPIINTKLLIFSNYLFRILKLFFNFCIVLGFFLILFNLKKIKPLYIKIAFLFLAILFVIVFLPSLSSKYNLSRAYLQTLFILSPLGIITILQFFRVFKIEKIIIPLLLFSFFLFSSGVIYQVIGGSSTLSFNNFGDNYNKYYINSEESASSFWMINNYNPDTTIYADIFGQLRLQRIAKDKFIFRELYPPSIISINSYIYFSKTNTQELSFSKYKIDTFFTYNLPTEFFKNNKNEIYTNGGSKIFK
jgi:uncharacterized membrane protein